MDNQYNIEQESIGSFVSRAITLFGHDVNTNRQIPLVYDGLKPVYRRAIYSAFNKGNTMTKSATIVGDMIGTTHPHGSDSCEDPVSNLVRWGIFEGQGDHGLKTLVGEDVERSASRYTEVKLGTNFQSIFKDLMPYVDYSPAELPGFTEPDYLPTPVPLSLTFGTLGIGNGVNSRVPAFTVTSLMKARQYDDPYLLEAPFGLELVKEESELDLLWTTGIGKLTYSFKVYEANSASGTGVYIEGDAELFKPRLREIEKFVELGRLYITDETDGSGSRIFIGRNYNVRGLPNSKILEMATEASKLTRTYRLTVSNGNQVYLIPLKEWLNTTYNNYYNTVERYRVDRLSKLKFEEKVFSNLSDVAKLIFDNRDITSKEISGKLDLEIQVVNAILQKSINTLRNEEGGLKKLNSIQSQIDHFINLNITEYINNVVHEF